MKTVKSVSIVALVLLLMTFMQTPFLMNGVLPQAVAQSPPIPTQIPVTGTATMTTSATTTLLAAPTGQVRNYVYQVTCINSSAGATLLTLIYSSTTATGTVAFDNCPASAANTGVINFNPPLQLPVASSLRVVVASAVTSIYAYASGFTAR